MGGASRFLMLLSNPSPLLHPRPSSSSSFFRLARRSLSSHHHHHHLPIYPCTPIPLHPRKPQTLTLNLNHRHPSIFRSQLHTSSAPPFDSKGSLSWPEWAKLVENLSHGGYFGRRSAGDGEDDELAGIEGMPEEFARAAGACLAFARDRPDALRLLAKKNVEVIVNGSLPSLFKNGASSARRMRAFLSGDESNALEFERAQTVDVMRYVLDYAYHSLNISEGIKQSNAEVVEASVRNVLAEFVNMSGTVQSSNFTESASRQPHVNHEQFSRHPVKNIEMKRGDWICPKCSFMNFARNTRCLECEEARPKKLLTGREWECPQCDFYNYGRNTSCLRCDCRRPVDIPAGTPYGKNSSIDQILSGSKTDESELEQRLAANDEKAERWFGKVSPPSDKVDMSSVANDEDFPEIMPLRKGVNRSVVSTRKTPLERRSANSQSAVSNEKSSESSINESLDRILGRTSTSQNIARTDPGHVPFVPLPPDMFGKPQNTNNEVQHKEDGSKSNAESSDASQRWSKKLAELDNATDVANAIPDEDFPDIMPMRKGENRFVVSKKKDRSLTSPQYKRRLAMEQANKSDFVPFVPFPPGYFAKKDEQPEAAAPPSSEAVSDNSAPTENSQVENRMYNQFSGNDLSESKQSWNSGVYQTNIASNSSIATGGSSNQERGKSQRLNQSGNGEVSQTNNASSIASPTWGSSNVEGQRSQSSSQSWNSGTSQTGNASDTTSTIWGSSNQGGEKSQSSSQSWNKGFTRKSLEGSAVTEPDPLDMSEEAKAARWFRRAAQIKSIEELSEIPDEDFPEIMPMRKGVNRFVVSKRKTPLERRLTSPQYRRSLPIVSSEPEKDSS